MTVSLPAGWVYLEVVDPGGGAYPIASVQRSDGANLLVGPNVWQTPARIHMVPPKPNNLIHIFDYNSTGSYTVTYGLPITLPSATTLAAVDITPTNATLNALVNPNGASTDVYFQWGATTNYGNVTATTTLTGSLNRRKPWRWPSEVCSRSATNHFQAVVAQQRRDHFGADLTVVTPPLPPPVITQVANQSIVVGQDAGHHESGAGRHPAGHLQPGQLRPGRRPSITTNGVLSLDADLCARQQHQSDYRLGDRQRQPALEQFDDVRGGESAIACRLALARR